MPPHHRRLLPLLTGPAMSAGAIATVLTAMLLGAAPAAAQLGRCTAAPLEAPRLTAAEQARRERSAAAGDTLRQLLVGVAREQGVEAPSELVLVELSRRGTLAGLRVLRGDLEPAPLREALSAQGALLARYADGKAAVYLRLDAPEREPGGAECMPEVLNGHELTRVLEELRPEEQTALLRAPLPTVIRMLVTRDGDVAYVGSIQSTRVPVRVRSELMAAAYRLRFLPLSVDGVPVDFWVEQPFQLRYGP
jgi:hypothetical protein